ncbi:hypothetical protein AS026_21070 [Rhizobium altiplani]|uniref:Uncharacterized protein n=1 Tax=Rhizobium altiplani TaxID=1864509 RepID=A0A109J4E1_9HYPH|nr:hypothetical protein [Rhizobium altiplani]KWV42104.1 hypothetical protein AS026_21070 [Rhizobium altiplani]
MTVTRFPAPDTQRLRLASKLENREMPDYQLRQVLGASDRLAVVNKALTNAAMRIVNDDALGPGDALVDGDTLRDLLPAVLNIINLCSSNRDRDLSRAVRQWLQVNGD